MAPVYDSFTYRNDYEMWFGLLLPLLEEHGLKQGRLLDVGCGSGKAFPPMLRRGWEIEACDVSRGMLARARERAEGRVTMHVADMRALPVFGEFELVWALNDPVNYMLNDGELVMALEGMRRNLGPGGLMLFDTNTIAGYSGFFAEETIFERDGWRLIWRGLADPDAPPGSVMEASFEAEPLEPGSGEPIAPEIHRERHFSEAQVLAALEQSGLECLDVVGFAETDCVIRPLDEDEHLKALFVARVA